MNDHEGDPTERGGDARRWRSCVRLLLFLLCVAGLPSTGGSRAHAGPVAQAAEEEEPVVREVQVVGARRFQREQILAAFGEVSGIPLDRAAVTRAIDRLWQGYRIRADVSLREVAGTDGREVDLLIEVYEMPLDFEPRFRGNSRFDEEDILGWAGIDGGEIYLHEASQIRTRIEEGYHREGHYFAEVDLVVSGETDGAADITFDIREGPRVKVRNMIVRGAESMPKRGWWLWSTGLKKLAGVQLGGPSTFFRIKPVFIRDELEADLLAMRTVYRNRGWLDAVVELERLEFNAARDRVTIHVVVDEGPRYKVASLDFEANELFQDLENPEQIQQRVVEPLFPVEDILAECDLVEGAFYEQNQVNRDAFALQNLYGDAGHISDPSLPMLDRWRFLDPRVVYDVENKLVHVTYRVAEGRPVFIREILFTGNLHTRDRVLRRELSVYPGELANMNEIRRSRQRITNTGFFSDQRNRLTHPDPRFVFRDTEDPSWKDLEFLVEEGNVIQFSFSGGVGDAVGAFISASATMTNFDITDLPTSPWPWDVLEEIGDKEAFHGDGQSFSVGVSPGTEVTEFWVSWRHPDIFGRHEDRISLNLRGQRRDRRFPGYDELRDSATVSFGRQLTRNQWLELGYRAQRVQVDDLDDDGEPSLSDPLAVPERLKEQEGTNDLSRLRLAFRHRDLDTVFDPHQGSRMTLTADWYDDVVGSDYDFVKLNLTGELYGQFGDPALDVRHGWKMRLGTGVAIPYGDTELVPYTESFFLGGIRSLRGFTLRGVGPNENGLPVGGETYLLTSLEYRIPLHSITQPGSFREIEMFRGALFVDAGIIDPDEFSLELNEMRASVGFAFGITYPLPFVFSFGFPIEDGFQDDKRVFNFDIGF